MTSLKDIVVVLQNGEKMPESVCDSLVVSYTMSNMWCAEGVYDSPFMSYGV